MKIAKNKGLTIIELLIVIGITAILATVTGISLFSYRPQQDLDLTVKSIVAVLRDTQQKSVNQDSESQWGIHFENVSGDRDFYATFMGAVFNNPPVTYYLKSNLEFTDPGEGLSKDIVFGKVTGLPQASTTIKIKIVNNAQSEKIITINANGTIEY